MLLLLLVKLIITQLMAKLLVIRVLQGISAVTLLLLPYVRPVDIPML
jgi:hypothetical protein